MADLADTRVSLAGQGILAGIAASTATSGACAAYVSGVQVTVRVVTGVTVAVGATLLIARQGSTYWAIGAVPAPPAVPSTPSGADPPVVGDVSPAPKPATRTGVLTCNPVSTATFRDGSWRSDLGPVDSADTYQGRYSGSSYGQNSGYAFYGSKPNTLAGATCLGITLHAQRLNAGDYAARTPTLRLVTQTTRPGGAPTLNETTAGPSLPIGGSVAAFALPTSWGQALIDGTRGGIGMTVAADSPYIQLAGRSSWSAAWVLAIRWQKG